MKRRIAIISLLTVAIFLSLCGCDQSTQQPILPTTATQATVPATEMPPSTEAVLGGGVRLYCLEACQQNFIYQFNAMQFYDNVADLQQMPGNKDTRFILAWVPASGHLYINEEEIDPNNTGMQVDDAEFWRTYAVTARTYFPMPATAEEAATAELAVFQSSAEPVTEVVTFIGEAGVEFSWQELALAMEAAGDVPEDLTQAQILVGELGRGNTENVLAILDPQIIGPTNRLACLQNPTWVYWAFNCSGLWWR